MINDLNILQINIRGLISKNIQHDKCTKLNNILQSKQIDIVLLQEWCATKRESVVAISETDSDSDNLVTNQTGFPSKYFPEYNAHFHSTECAILYHRDLAVTPLEKNTEYYLKNHRKNFHICGIILHSGHTDYGIYSVYRPQNADPT